MEEGAKPTHQPQRRLNPHMQEKTTFTCPFGTYAYRRMPFGLCNALLPSKDACLVSSVIWLNESWKSSWMT
ncbi:hypothetical protein AAG906_018448 [Vitis piasezkii]